MKRLAGFGLAAAGLAMAFAAHAAEPKWARTWGASPQAPMQALGPFPATPTFHDQTLRQVVRISGGGDLVRIRFTNEFGTGPLTVGSAHLALAEPGGAIKPGSDHVLTFAGKPTGTARAGAPLLSDPVSMPVAALSRLAITIYLPDQVDACSCHGTAMEPAYLVAGNHAADAALPGATVLQTRALISAVDVAGGTEPRTIVAFGDSITDGVGSTPGADRRWPDRLAERLLQRNGAPAYVSNEGISGNRVLNDGFGAAALARFDRDVLSTPGLAYVIVFEGINDINMSTIKRDAAGPLAGFAKAFPGGPISADELIAADRQMIARAHERGVKIYGATITPFQGGGPFNTEGEAMRQAVNTWIRTSGAFDAVLDFDAAIRDPAQPSQIKDGYHMGDHLHGSDAGYLVIANSIDLELFK